MKIKRHREPLIHFQDFGQTCNEAVWSNWTFISK